MTDMNPAAEAARESARAGNGTFGEQTHTAPEAALVVDELGALGQRWAAASAAEREVRDAAQALAARRLRHMAPLEATNLLFVAQGAHDPFEKSYIERAVFQTDDQDRYLEDEDGYDEQAISDYLSFLDVEWVRDNADEVFRDGTALLMVGPDAEAERIPAMRARLEAAESGTDEYRAALAEVVATSDYVLRGRVHQAGFEGIFVQAQHAGPFPTPVGFTSDGKFTAFDVSDRAHAAVVEHLRFAVQHPGWAPDLTAGQHVRYVS